MGTSSYITQRSGAKPSSASPGRAHLSGSQAGPLGHEGLLTLARKVRAAAADQDLRRLEGASTRFIQALDRHLLAEAGRVGRVEPAEARLLEKGQRRIRATAFDLLVDASRGCPVPDRGCDQRAEELVALLSIQAHDEHMALDRAAL